MIRKQRTNAAALVKYQPQVNHAMVTQSVSTCQNVKRLRCLICPDVSWRMNQFYTSDVTVYTGNHLYPDIMTWSTACFNFELCVIVRTASTAFRVTPGYTPLPVRLREDFCCLGKVKV